MNDKEPEPAADNIRKPSHLSKKAADHWDVIVEELLACGVMTNLDSDALAMYCEAYSRWVDANEHLKATGMIVRSPNGFPQQSPFLQVSNKAFEQMKSLLTEFGMTPSSRTKVQRKEGEEPTDPWQKI